MDEDRYFSFDPNDGGYAIHATELEAKLRAQTGLEHERSVTGTEMWSDGVERICWGEIKQRVMEVSRGPVPVDDDGNPERTDVDEIVEYELRRCRQERMNDGD